MMTNVLSMSVVASLLASAFLISPAIAQEQMAVSQCQAVATRLPAAQFTSLDGADSFLTLAQSSAEEVRITFVAHSTYLIETPGGVSIATDFNGYTGAAATPTVVTMNKAHSGHYTASPDPAIEHVLRGWNPEGGAADHDIVVGDTYIRNVTTDIRAGYEGMEADGNSIFIFEVAGLCIGHLGHLHHALTDEHYGEIGRLDIVMVPTDGGLTMGAEEMSQVVRRLRSSLVLPMHRMGPSLSAFIELMGEDWARDYVAETGITVSLRSLPERPTVMILQGM
ncbi:MBL fold metallo-hydrolase [Georhizobium sp. MAB10]|uniref:MBL fold metallo-hydrolase n=1 Tax=Georhizobium sp. MAB10 TaxID=3028319 RepID=UPI0038560377